jgi:hypothetical protein
VKISRYSRDSLETFSRLPRDFFETFSRLSRESLEIISRLPRDLSRIKTYSHHHYCPVPLRRILTNDNLTDGELSYLTPNNICAGQSCGQFHFCRRLDICRQLDSVHLQENKSNINIQAGYLLIHFITNYQWVRNH